MASSPTVRPVATAVSRQDSSPPRPCRRCAVASVKENSYGPVSTRVPGGCVVSRSVRCSNPPSRQTAVTRSATTRSPTATIALAGIVRWEWEAYAPQREEEARYPVPTPASV